MKMRMIALCISFIVVSFCGCSVSIESTVNNIEESDDVKNAYSMRLKVSTLDDTQEQVSAGDYMNQITLAERRVQTYIELMDTTSFYQRILRVSGTNYSVDAITDMITFEPIKGTAFFYVTVTGSDAKNVNLISQALVQEMPIYISEIQTESVLKIVEIGEQSET